jgi:hypothetical protein
MGRGFYRQRGAVSTASVIGSAPLSVAETTTVKIRNIPDQTHETGVPRDQSANVQLQTCEIVRFTA